MQDLFTLSKFPVSMCCVSTNYNNFKYLDKTFHYIWDETVGVDKFLKKLDNTTYKIINTHILSPTLIIKKIK